MRSPNVHVIWRGFPLSEALESRRLLSAAPPTDAEQYLIELTNRARANPAAEAALFGIDLNEGLAAGTISADPKQPLAINPFLTDAARSHSQWMIDNQTFSHNEGTVTPAQQMQAAGYVLTPPAGAGQNIAYRGTKPAVPPLVPTVAQEHRDLFVDATVPDRGHRLNILDPDFREMGAGIVTGLFQTYNSVMTTEDFAFTAGNPFLTGVAYTDAVTHDQFYTPGEGLGGVTITATRISDNAQFSTTTYSSGGYSLQLAPGTYSVAATGGNLGAEVDYDNVVIGSQNVKRDFTPPTPSSVAARYVFYNHSAVDGNDAGANAQDDNAIATDKAPLLPGHTATFANYTSYSRGINGVMIDVDGLPTTSTPRASDFTFKVGNDNNPAGWASAPAPTSVTVRPAPGATGRSRITIVWPDGAIQKQWLQITANADGRTGLSTPDVFYFGNAVGDSGAGNTATQATVNATDEIGARNDPHNFTNPAPITNTHDYNRDTKVDATDQIIARTNGTNFVSALKLITPASPGPTNAVTLQTLAAAFSSSYGAAMPTDPPRSKSVLPSIFG